MANLASSPAMRAAFERLAVGVETARRLRHLDAVEDARAQCDDGYDAERAAMRQGENGGVRALAWAAHRRLWGVLEEMPEEWARRVGASFDGRNVTD